MIFVKNLALILAILLVIDGTYLSLTGATFLKMVTSIQKSEVKIRWFGAALCYLCMVLLFYLFVVRKNSNYPETFALGALSYGIYDSVNYSLFSGWDGLLALQDTLWGGVLFVIAKMTYEYVN